MNLNVPLFLALAASLGGCTYVHSYFAKSDLDDASAFCEQSRSDPALRPIAGKLPIVSPDEISPEMLALDALPTDAELEAIKDLSRDQRACRQRLRAVMQAHEPTQLATREELNMKLDLVTAELLKRNMSYGNANRLYRQASLEASDKLTEQAKQDMADAQEREAATWRSLGQSLAGVAKPKDAMPHSEKSCSWVDSSIDCSTH
jgi:hypothetical protein